jgi:hypothetical protein
MKGKKKLSDISEQVMVLIAYYIRLQQKLIKVNRLNQTCCIIRTNNKRSKHIQITVCKTMAPCIGNRNLEYINENNYQKLKLQKRKLREVQKATQNGAK